MSYLHIRNLYQSQDILLFRECYALEKVHGTSAHVAWKDGELRFFSGGENHKNFVALFDQEALIARFKEIGLPQAIVYGEAYGGKCQGMKETYGDTLRFIAFDVKVGDAWLAVPNMNDLATGLGLEVVPWMKVPTDIWVLDGERDKTSEVAVRRGCGNDKVREGVVLRPLIELTKNNGERIIAKHKADKFSERATPQKIIDPEKLVVLEQAKAIADEWCTEQRLGHVLQKMPGATIEQTKDVISAMVEDIYREAKGEIVESKEAGRAIGAKTAAMFKQRLKSVLHEPKRQVDDNA